MDVPVDCNQKHKTQVLDFFQSILSADKESVHYEHLRQRCWRAPLVVKEYVRSNCKGQDLLKYFERRKNYFTVENAYVSLNKKNWLQMKIQNKQSNSSASRNPVIQKALTYLKCIEFFVVILEKKPKPSPVEKLRGFLSQASPSITTYIRSQHGSYNSFLKTAPSLFHINNEEDVILSDNYQAIITGIKVSIKNAQKGLLHPTSLFSEIRTMLRKSPDDKTISPFSIQIKEANDLLASIDYFVNILEKKNKAMPFHHLNGCLSQASKDIRTFVLSDQNKGFKSFFKKAKSVFFINGAEEVSLSLNYRTYVKCLKDLVDSAIKILIQPAFLQSRIDAILQSKMVSVAQSDLLQEDLSPNKTTQKQDTLKSSKVSSSPTHKGSELKEPSRTESESSFTPECNKELIQCVFAVELFCLEMTEKEFYTWGTNQISIIQYFISFLLKRQWCSIAISDLKASLLNAPDNVVEFMNERYSGEAFVSFFKENSEFDVRYGFVKLAFSYQTKQLEKKSFLSEFSPEKTKGNVHKFYETKLYQKYLKETFALLFELYDILRHKGLAKISEFELILYNYRNCLRWIKASEGRDFPKQIVNFLRIFKIFTISTDASFVYCSNPSSLLTKWLKLKQVEFLDSESGYVSFPAFCKKFFPVLNFNSDTFPEVENVITSDTYNLVRYYELVDIVPLSRLHEIIQKSDSRYIIKILCENRELVMCDGMIKLKNPSPRSYAMNKIYSPRHCIVKGLQSNKVNSSIRGRVPPEPYLEKAPNTVKEEKNPQYKKVEIEYNKSKNIFKKLRNEDEHSSQDSEGPINFTREHRSQVCDFFENVLVTYKNPAYYEHLRGHVSNAPPIVRTYIRKKCKGTKLLDFFQQNTKFIVDGDNVSLDREISFKTIPRNKNRQLKVNFDVDKKVTTFSYRESLPSTSVQQQKKAFKSGNDSVHQGENKTKDFTQQDNKKNIATGSENKQVEVKCTNESIPLAPRGRTKHKELRLQKEKMKQEEYEKNIVARQEKFAKLVCEVDLKRRGSRSRSRSKSKTRSRSRDKKLPADNPKEQERAPGSGSESRSEMSDSVVNGRPSTAKRGRKRESRRKRLRLYKEKLKQQEEELKNSTLQENFSLSQKFSEAVVEGVRSSDASSVKSNEKTTDTKREQERKSAKKSGKERSNIRKEECMKDPPIRKRSPSVTADKIHEPESQETLENCEENSVNKEYVMKYFTGLLTRQQIIQIDSIEFDLLPKKVQRYLTQYFKKEVREYFSKYSQEYCIDEAGNVFLWMQP